MPAPKPQKNSRRKGAKSSALELARQVLRIEADAVAALIPRLDQQFLDAISLILNCRGRVVVSVLGDGDFIQGITALWTAAHYRIPALFIVSNNRSNFNDEIHQEAVAKMRDRAVENRWIGQRIDDPVVDITAMARAQGVDAEGPVHTVPDLEVAIARGLAVVASGKPYLIDTWVKPGYANPPLSRGG